MARTCTGDCLKCSFQQQTYCAAQFGHAIMGYMPAIIERLDRLFGQTEILNPLKAQKASGAENREAENP